MASFCEKCGFPQSGNSSFCPQCGGRVTASAPAPAPVWNAAPPPVAPTAKGGGLLKVLVVLVVCFVVAGFAVVGGLYYVGHKVKQAVVQQANSYAVDLPSIPSPVSHGAKARTYKPCELLSKQDVERIIGQPIDHTEHEGEMCSYYGPPGLATKLAQQQASATFKRAQAPGAQPNGSDITNAVDQLANNMGIPGANTGTGGEMPLIMLAVIADGKPQMTAVAASNAIFSGIFNAADPKGTAKFGANIPGLGDRAIRLPKLGLSVLQGETMVRVMPGPIPDADAKTIEIVRAVLPKL